MEMDFIPSRLELARDVQRRYEWDYVIGSVHIVGDRFGFEGSPVRIVYRER